MTIEDVLDIIAEIAYKYAHNVKDVCESFKKRFAAEKNGPCVWISVEDRLPEIKDNHVSDVVLAWCQNEDVMVFTELEETFFGGLLFGIERTGPDGEETPVVTHWMPLPEPPVMEVK